jgi:hypothetical protein
MIKKSRKSLKKSRKLYIKKGGKITDTPCRGLTKYECIEPCIWVVPNNKKISEYCSGNNLKKKLESIDDLLKLQEPYRVKSKRSLSTRTKL